MENKVKLLPYKIICIPPKLDIIYYNFIITRLNNSCLEEKKKIKLIIKYAECIDSINEKKKVFIEVLKEIHDAQEKE